MTTEQIKDLIEKAEANAIRYGGKWHISSQGQILPDCYFYDERGLPKIKEYYSLYNTEEKIYRDIHLKIIEGTTWHYSKQA